MADAKPCTKPPWEKYTDSKISKKDLQKEFYSRIFKIFWNAYTEASAWKYFNILLEMLTSYSFFI